MFFPGTASCFRLQIFRLTRRVGRRRLCQMGIWETVASLRASSRSIVRNTQQLTHFPFRETIEVLNGVLEWNWDSQAA